MGWLSRRFGLTIDNLLSVDLITAEGRALHTSLDIEPELFWGVRGGGGNFGVATKFRFKMHPLGPVLVGRWSYPRQAFDTVLRGYRDLAAKAPRELTTAFTMTSTTMSVSAFWGHQLPLGFNRDCANAGFGILRAATWRRDKRR